MKTADWALVISILSALISLAGFVWNVWSKFIYPKPIVRVKFAMVTIVDLTQASRDIDVLTLSATNMGPSEVTLTKAIILFQPRWFSDKRYGILNLLPNSPLSTDFEREFEQGGGMSAGGQLPKKLAVGEQFTVYLVPHHEALARGDYKRVGFSDTFDREHWAPTSDKLAALSYIRAACEKSGVEWRTRRRTTKT